MKCLFMNRQGVFVYEVFVYEVFVYEVFVYEVRIVDKHLYHYQSLLAKSWESRILK